MKLNHNMVELDYNERLVIRNLIKKEGEVLSKLMKEDNNEKHVKNYRVQFDYLEEIFNKIKY